MSDYIASLIRTYIPIWVGVALAWLNEQVGPLDIGPELGAVLAGALATVYYGLARKLEQKYPHLGWLLGHRSQPVYISTSQQLAKGHNG